MTTVDFADPALPERFWDKVVPEPTSGCWLWDAYIDPTGYARINWQGRAAHAYRVAYLTLVGPIPAGLWLDHLCRVRSCVRPEHLEAVTPYENRIRGEQGGYGALRGRCKRGHRVEGFNLVRTHRGYPVCRICRNEEARIRMRAVKARKRAELVDAARNRAW